MKVSTLLDDVLNVLHSGTPNQDIETFVQSKFGKSYMVYRGVDPNNAPEPENYPIIVIKGIDRAEQGEESRFFTYVLQISVTILNSNIDTSTNPSIVDYEGLKQVEEFREVVENVLIASQNLSFMVHATGETFRESIYPVYHSDSLLMLSVPQNMRGGRR